MTWQNRGFGGVTDLPDLQWTDEDEKRIDLTRIPRRPWDKSLLNRNARLMRGTSLEITKKNMESCDWVAEKP